MGTDTVDEVGAAVALGVEAVQWVEDPWVAVGCRPSAKRDDGRWFTALPPVMGGGNPQCVIGTDGGVVAVPACPGATARSTPTAPLVASAKAWVTKG